MSSAADSAAKSASMKPTKVLIPKVWKRPHSTIYGKNVEFGSRLTSDKLGEINGRKFNSELPWQVRNSGASSTSSTSLGSTSGYLSKLLNEPESTLIGSVVRRSPTGSYGYDCSFTSSGVGGVGGVGGGGGGGDGISGSGGGGSSSYSLGGGRDPADELSAASCINYADVLDLTNPSRYSKRRRGTGAGRPGQSGGKNRRIDFFENYLNFSNELTRMSESSRLMSEPLLQRRAFDKSLDFNHELGLFVPSSQLGELDERSLMRKRTLQRCPLVGQHSAACPTSSAAHEHETPHHHHHHLLPHHHHQQQQQQQQQNHHHQNYFDNPDANPSQHDHNHHYHPVVTTTKQTHLLPKHDCQLAASPYGVSADGRKLSLGSINPQSYRPSLPNKSSTVHASDGEEFEFQDRSSPFFTDRWAGKTIRHFDSDLYSNASLFKSMIL